MIIELGLQFIAGYIDFFSINDYNKVPGVNTDAMYGVKKTRFNSQDFGVFTVDTAVRVLLEGAYVGSGQMTGCVARP